MATLVLTDASVTINSVDLSDHVRSVTFNYNAEALDETAMTQDTRINRAGLFAWDLEVEFYQDYAASEIDQTLNGLVGAAAFPIEVKPTSAATSATNPAYQGNAILTSYAAVAGGVGEMAMARASFASAGSITRAVA